MKKLKLPTRRKSQARALSINPTPDNDIPTNTISTASTTEAESLLLLLPLELRLEIFSWLDVVDTQVLRWTCNSLRVILPELDLLSSSPCPPGAISLSPEERLALGQRVRLSRFVRLCDAGKDQVPDSSRALCFKCLDYHKLPCFFPEALYANPRWRICKKDARVRLCPCLSIDRITLANLNNRQRWGSGATPVDIEHKCGLINSEKDAGAVSLACYTGWWNWLASLTVNYERNAFNNVHTDVAVAEFISVARDAKLELCPHMCCEEESTCAMLRSLHHKSKRTIAQPGPVVEKCSQKSCETTVAWRVKGTWIRLLVKRELGDIWKGDALGNPRWLAQLSESTGGDGDI